MNAVLIVLFYVKTLKKGIKREKKVKRHADRDYYVNFFDRKLKFENNHLKKRSIHHQTQIQQNLCHGDLSRSVRTVSECDLIEHRCGTANSVEWCG